MTSFRGKIFAPNISDVCRLFSHAYCRTVFSHEFSDVLLSKDTRRAYSLSNANYHRTCQGGVKERSMEPREDTLEE